MSDSNPPADHIIDDNEPQGSMEDNLKSKSTWVRLVFMVIFGIVANIVGFVTAAIVVLGFLFVLFTGEVNDKLRRAGAISAAYLAEIISFLTFNTDTKPFPFDAELPSASDDAE